MREKYGNYLSAVMSAEEGNRDINSVFTDILLSEERIIQESYKEGFNAAASQQSPEGFHLGYHRGSELGSELGYYLGVAESYLSLPAVTSGKAAKDLSKLVKLIHDFPVDNRKDVDILALADDIRTLFKKSCALLKIDAHYPESDNLSF